jgi:hypothetical protein
VEFTYDLQVAVADLIIHSKSQVQGHTGMRQETYEINTDCGNVGFRVGIVGEPQEKAGLSDTGVSDEEELEEIVVSSDAG